MLINNITLSNKIFTVKIQLIIILTYTQNSQGIVSKDKDF